MWKCKYCLEKEKTWDKWNSPIECAFEKWFFSENNWNCWSMDFLREKVEDNSVYNEDTYAWIIPYNIQNKDNEDIWFIYLEWYKSRWRTDKCIDMETQKPIKLEKVYKVINFEWCNF